MGGANTEVTGGTKRVLLGKRVVRPRVDPAHLTRARAPDRRCVPVRARRRRRRARDRVRPSGGAHRETAGDDRGGVVDAYPRKRQAQHVRLRMSRVKRVLGIAPSPALARKVLTGLGLPVKSRGADLEVTVPSFRRDLSMEDDLVEEIIRVWGYDRIPSTLPGGAISLVTHPATSRQSQTVRQALVGAGLAEVVTYAFSDPARVELLPPPRRFPSPSSS